MNLLGDCFLHSKDDVKVYNMIEYHDEAQYALHRSLLKVKVFFDKERQKQYEADLEEWKNNGADKKSKPENPFEKEAKQFLADMKIEDPENLYSAIGHLDNGMYYVTLPNIVSKTIIEQIDNVVKELNVNVPLGIEWISGSNWYLMMPVYVVIHRMN